MSEGLLPCPFCGGEALPACVADERGNALDAEGCRVTCRACGAATDRYGDALDAEAAWNARAERECRRVSRGPLMGDECGACGCGLLEGFRYCPSCGARVAEL